MSQAYDLSLPYDNVRQSMQTNISRGADKMISVALISYNGEKYIRHQLESILCQLPQDGEVVVSDDGSTDATRQIVSEMAQADKRIRLVDGPCKGVIKNMENAIANTRVYDKWKPDGGRSGAKDNICEDYLFMADQDDEWMPDKIEKVVRAFEEHSVDLVMHDVRVMNGDLTEELMPSFFEYRGSCVGFWKNMIKNRYMGCAMALRANRLADSIPIPEDVPMHDQWIGMRNDMHGNGGYCLPDKLLLYRRHGGNVSDFDKNSVWVMIRNRVRLLIRLLTY